MRKRASLVVALAVFTATFAAGGPLGAQTNESEIRNRPERVGGSVSSAFELRSPEDIVQVFIQLDEPAVAQTAASGADSAAQRIQGEEVLAQQEAVRQDIESLVVDEIASLQVGANGFRALVRAGDIPAIRAAEGVKSVAAVTRFYLDNASSVPWIGGDTVQGDGFTGEGTTIAVIDSGIDYTHAAFGGPGTEQAYDENDTGVVEAGSFPTAKVVNGFDFAGPVYNADDPNLDTPSPDADPLDVNGHGTHVAGSAAGMGSAEVGVGMAPDADLLALKVFGDVAGSTDLVSDAIEFALDPNNDLSTDDAVDVINMSLGAPFGNPDDPSAIASQNAVDLGVVVVASAGNEGTAPYVTGSPAVAADVISVAASTDGGVEALAMTVNSPAEIARDYEAQEGDFGSLDPDVTGDLAIAEPLDACGAGLSNDLSGHIAYIQRGTCSFSEKIRNAEAAGAEAALVFNNVEGPPIAMSQDGTPDQPEIPAMMIGLADGEDILAVAHEDTVNVTLTNDVVIPKPELADNLADFTSRGPGTGNTFKPDVSAPGFNIASADVGSGDGAALNSGTSMAAPHIAGAAAQLLEKYPDVSPAQIKGLLTGSASPALVEGPVFEAGAVPVARQGTGVVDVARAALDMEGYAMPNGVVFRLNPTEEVTETATIDISRLDGAADVTYDVALETNQELPGVTWGISDTTVATSGGIGSVDVSVTADPSAMGSDDGFFSQSESDGWLVLTSQSDDDDEIRVGLVAVADPASEASAVGGEDTVELANTGPAAGFADGFTHIGDGLGVLSAVGYRTGEVTDETGTYRTIDFGVAFGTGDRHLLGRRPGRHRRLRARGRRPGPAPGHRPDRPGRHRSVCARRLVLVVALLRNRRPQRPGDRLARRPDGCLRVRPRRRRPVRHDHGRPRPGRRCHRRQ